jgi:polar amino acid transport system substrate-binding protein
VFSVYPNPPTSRRAFLKRSAVLGGAALSGGFLAACSRTNASGGGGSTSAASTLEKIKKQGYVTVGFANERPYGFRKGGELVGEAPAISGKIFDAMGGIELRGKLFQFDALIPALSAGRVDVVTAGMFITPERCGQAAFGQPEYVVPSAFLVKKGNPKNLSDYQSVIDSDAKLAVLSGAVEVEQATGAGVADSQLMKVSDQQAGLDAVKSGRADALNLTSISLRALAENASGVEVAEPFTPEVDGKKQYGAGAAVFRQDDQDLLKAYNDQLAKILADDQAWLSLVKPFGFTLNEKPPAGLTTQKLCNG